MLLFRNALAEHAEMTRQDTRTGTLTNVEFVVSDHVAVSGYKTGIGIPEYLSEQTEAAEDAALVAALFENSAPVSERRRSMNLFSASAARMTK